MAAAMVGLTACSASLAQTGGARGEAGASVTTPSDHLGRPLGVDFELADWDEVSDYYKRLAQQSPNVITQREGTTTEGREFLLSIISSPQNLANLDQIKAHARTIADPRGKTEAQLREAIEEGKVILLISCAMHSTETAAPQFGMEFAYTLATSSEEPWVSARENMVIAIFPTMNPDGLDEVVSWYRKTVGTPFETSGLPRLYQKYAGHDNNRDWFMLSLDETRIATRLLYSEWYPTVYWDVHQQGSGGERMFVPPFRDPLNPNLDASIIAGIDALGSRALLDMTAEGLTGVATGISYDMWWNGGNRNVPVRHNIIGLLTEAASVRLATPIFQRISDLSNPITREAGYIPSNQHPAPWPGGWWRLRDIIDYEMSFGRSLLGSLSREPRVWIANKLGAGQRSIEAGKTQSPRAWIVPSDNADPGAVKRLMDVLLLGGVEVHVSTGEVSADGRSYPAGSIVIRRDQPYGRYVKDLFEAQKYPEGAPPYDVAGWTLPALMGVRQVEATQMPAGDLVIVETPEAAVAAFGGLDVPEGAWSSRRSETWPKLVAGLRAGKGYVLTGSTISEHPDPRTAGPAATSLPRIGLYAPYSGSMDEGWTRWVFDHFEIPFVTVRNETLRAGDLSDVLDVLVIPSIRAGQLENGRSDGSVPSELTGGIGVEGAQAIERFVADGGRLITIGSSSAWAIETFSLPLKDVTRGEASGEFSCPGGVLRTTPGTSMLASGLDNPMAVFFSRSSAYRLMTAEERKEADIIEGREVEGLLHYAKKNVLLSGWIREPEVIEGQIAWAQADYGKGKVHVFGFRPQYRSWTHGSFQMLFRAIFFGG
jgi:zinc carboxypeptidase